MMEVDKLRGLVVTSLDFGWSKPLGYGFPLHTHTPRGSCLYSISAVFIACILSWAELVMGALYILVAGIISKDGCLLACLPYYVNCHSCVKKVVLTWLEVSFRFPIDTVQSILSFGYLTIHILQW
ncbi:hypothetical protein FOVG_00022 [Fusarium oxysporum f. sp. pisi HDV247]|uniref:Uncharacterized protein n=1 Tax=Fusarium oxysporum f. sp. pisi HDV247 TaxID=1080344 RepID=W9Q1T2_FUSOX|nr:hypothetical protein FOVG_00022 [Fusarium oxysporum f. sp. pisi HDV247]